MPKKEIFVITSVIVLFIAVAFIVAITGASNGGNNYVRLEVNPIMEFIVDSGEVVSYRVVNDEAKELLIQEEILGLTMEEATEKFLTLCAKAGYLDVDGEDNALKMTAISGMTQEDDVKVFRAAQKFFVDNRVLGIIIQNDDDMEVIKAAKEEGISTDKYALMKAARECYPDKIDEELKKMNSVELLELIKQGQLKTSKEYTVEELTNKSKLVDFNRVKYQRHQDSIAEDTGSEFVKSLTKFQKENTVDYETSFSEKYREWENSVS